MKRHNYEKKILEMIAKGEITQVPGRTYVFDVTHKDGCESCNNGICNCDCEIMVTELDSVPGKVH